MGSCGSTSEKDSKSRVIRVNRRPDKGVEGDNIVPENLANQNDINKKYKL